MKELRVLMLNGSPRANGNTSIALREMEKIFTESGVAVETVQVGNQAVRILEIEHCEDGVGGAAVLALHDGVAHAQFLGGHAVREDGLAVQADPCVIGAGDGQLHIGIFLHVLVDLLLRVRAEPELAVQLIGKHEGAALGVAVASHGGQILHGVGIQEFNDFVQRHGLVPPGLLHWVCGASRRAPADEAMIHPFLPGVKYAQCGNLVTGG